MPDETQDLSAPSPQPSGPLVSIAPPDLSELAEVASDNPAPAPPAHDSSGQPAQSPLPAHAPALIECPRCGTKTDARLNRCVECGYRFTVRCPECGAVNSGEASACGKCGHRLISAAYGAWTVGPAVPRVRARRSARGTQRIGSRKKTEGRSPLFYVMVVTGLIALALAILILALLVVPDFL
jgi:hypothetical protein